jgi:uncharacterized membrane protein
MFTMIGLYFIFSNTIIRAISNLDNGGFVMVAINRTILNPIFYFVFILSTVSSVYLCFHGTDLECIAGIVFFIGTFLVTVIKNVPLNNHLLASLNKAEHHEVWLKYQTNWKNWNHLRAFSAFSSGCLLLI